jgi:hypothetical protein
MAKIISVSHAGTLSYATLPGGTGELSNEAGQIDDTIFGQSFGSKQSGVIKWGVSANALYKGFAGYEAKIKSSGTSTTFTSEVMSLVSGFTYKIADTAKNAWDRTATFAAHFTNGTASGTITGSISSVDYLHGRITFNGTFSGTVTVNGKYLPLTTLGKGNSFTLTQQAAEIQTTTFALAQANGGFHTFDPGLRTVKFDMNGIYASASGLIDALIDREELIIEIGPDGDDLSVARGFFKAVTEKQSGAVGALEDEMTSFELFVPASPANLLYPFRWVHAAATTLPTALQTLLDAWQNETKIAVRYLEDGTNGRAGASSIITDLTLKGGLEAMNDFTVNLRGDGAHAAYP